MFKKNTNITTPLKNINKPDFIKKSKIWIKLAPIEAVELFYQQIKDRSEFIELKELFETRNINTR